LLDILVTQQWDEQQFLDYAISLEVEIANQIKSTEIYQTFVLEKDSLRDRYKCPPIPSIAHTKWIYEDIFAEKYFISVDLQNANFQALKFFSKKLVFDCNSWEEFVGTFCKFDYFKKAKHFRQNIIGHLERSFVELIWKYLMHQVMEALLEGGVINVQDIAHKGGDELVISTTKDNFSEKVTVIQNFLQTKLPDHIVKVEAFFLRKINMQKSRKNYQFYVKEIFTSDGIHPALKCVYPTSIFVHAYKFYFKLEETGLDTEIAKIGPKNKNKK